jgi:hypothetical protein
MPGIAAKTATMALVLTPNQRLAMVYMVAKVNTATRALKPGERPLVASRLRRFSELVASGILLLAFRAAGQMA